MAGNEVIQPGPDNGQPQQDPENTLLIEGREFSIENATFTKMYGLVSVRRVSLPGDFLTADELTPEELVAQYKDKEYGYREFTRVEVDITFNGDEGEFSQHIQKDVYRPGVTYFNGVVETLEDVEKDPERAHTARWMRETGEDRIINVQANVMEHQNGHRIGHFETYAFRSEDRVLTPGHTDPIKV